MSNLYHRKLLSDIELPEIDRKLHHAISYLENDKLCLERAFKDALINRLALRRQILSAARIDDIVNPQRALFWERCTELLPRLKTTAQLGKPVDRSFSAKMQRSLASTVPPKPIVIIRFDDAHTYLSRLCQYGRDAYRILDYHGGPNMLVGRPHEMLLESRLFTNWVDMGMGIPISEPSTIYIHTSASPVFHF